MLSAERREETLMKIKGLQKLTLLDYPGELACTVFLFGCNFRCPFCHNASLVLNRGDDEEISESEFFEFLSSRVGRLSAVCISGGEPTLNPEIFEFISKIKAMGFKVKLDTNGYKPSAIRELISASLLDYVAMDIKNSPESYAATAGLLGIDISLIKESAELLRSSGVDFEFRTTVVRELHSLSDIRSIGEWLAGGEKFYLQAFKDSGDIISGGLSSPTEQEMDALLSELKKYIPLAEKR